jgi:hypothetical protein
MQETEYTLVVAAPKSHLIEVNPHILAMHPVDLDGIDFSFAFYFEQEQGIRAVNLKVDEIADLLPIYRQNAVPTPKACPRCERTFFDMLDRNHVWPGPQCINRGNNCQRGGLNG